MKMKIQDAVDDWLRFREVTEAVGFNTLKSDRSQIKKLTGVCPTIMVHNITQHHVEQVIMNDGGNKPASINALITTMRVFFKHCRRRGWVPTTFDPMMGIKMRPDPKRQWQHLTPEQVQRVFDVAPCPRNRAILATAYYLFSRRSELATVKVKDWDRNAGTLRVIVHKAHGTVDYMPVCDELDEELRRWILFYQDRMGGALDPEWRLFPVKQSLQNLRCRYDETEYTYITDRSPTHMERIALPALRDAGFPIREADGSPSWQGMHTLRRAGARHFFDSLCSESYDGALRVVQSMLHHKMSTTTEQYLGLTLDKNKRDQLLKGNRMFPRTVTDNVIPLHRDEVG